MTGVKVKNIKKIVRYMFIGMVLFAVLCALILAVTNYIVVSSTKKQIVCAAVGSADFETDDTETLKTFGAECIMVLGAGIKDRETPSLLLRDRLDTGIALYKAGVAPKLLLTGDNGQANYNEIHVMLNYSLKAGVPPEDIFCDHAGFSTYDSMHRAKSIFRLKKMIVVTQTYHLYRSLYIAESQGLEAMAVGADQARYSGQLLRDIREVLARTKDVAKCVIDPGPTIGGEAIPVSGSGVETHGE